MTLSPTYKDETRLTISLGSADGSAGQSKYELNKITHPSYIARILFCEADASQHGARILENNSLRCLPRSDYVSPTAYLSRPFS